MTSKINEEKRLKQMIINVFISFVLFTAIAFCIDGFILHPISNQGKYLNLSNSNTLYATATILDENHSLSQACDIFLVKKDEEIHLLYFKKHFPTGRYVLAEDVTIDVPNKEVFIGNSIEYVNVTIENNKIANMGGSYNTVTDSTVYPFVGVICTILESLIFSFYLKRKYS